MNVLKARWRLLRRRRNIILVIGTLVGTPAMMVLIAGASKLV